MVEERRKEKSEEEWKDRNRDKVNLRKRGEVKSETVRIKNA